VAGLATQFSIGDFQHALAELSLMRIFVATRACEIIPAVNRSRHGFQFRAFFVTVATRSSDMSSRQGELRLFVPGQSEGGRSIAFQGVALLASVEIRRRGELGIVLVGVTVGAVLEVDFK